MYKIIDEKLHLASCSIADLTIQQVTSFLEQWEHGAHIGGLTLFFDATENLVVLNRDNKNYATYLSIAQEYLKADSEDREKFADEAPDGLKETIQVLEHASQHIRMQNKYKIIASHHPVVMADSEAGKFIDFLLKRHSDLPVIAMSCIYNYGVIQGKRAERARRKRGA